MMMMIQDSFLEKKSHKQRFYLYLAAANMLVQMLLYLLLEEICVLYGIL